MAANYGETAMKKIRVDCSKLRATLVTNREKHKKEYHEGMEGYRRKRDAAIRYIGTVATECDLTRKVGRADVHKAWDAYKDILRNEPVDRTGSYDQAIAFMKWETREEIKVSLNDFECYVRDNWSWSSDHRSKFLSNRG